MLVSSGLNKSRNTVRDKPLYGRLYAALSCAGLDSLTSRERHLGYSPDGLLQRLHLKRPSPLSGPSTLPPGSKKNQTFSPRSPHGEGYTVKHAPPCSRAGKRREVAMARLFCDRCHKESNFLLIYAVMKVAGVSRSTIYYWLEHGWVHCLQ